MSERKDSDKINPDDIVHEIDGIVELNHPAPFWWQSIFYASIVWAIGYMGFYLAGSGRSAHDSLIADLANLQSGVTTPVVSPEEEKAELLAAFKNPERMVAARAIFTKNCVSCHAADGGGGIGPNLTDTSWIHGDGSSVAILKVVREGVLDKGMPPWGPILKREETIAVSAYVRSLRGGVVAKPKAPQGTVVTYSEEK